MKDTFRYNQEGLYKSLYNHMVNGDIAQLLKFAYEIWKMPISGCDAHYNLIGMYPKSCIDDISYDSYVTNGKISDSLIQGFIQEEYMVSIMTSEEPYIVDWGFINKPRVVYRLMDNHTFYGALAIILLEDYKWSDSDSELLKIIAGAITQMLSHGHGPIEYSESHMEWSFSSLLQRETPLTETIDKTYELLGLSTDSTFQLIAITPMTKAQPFLIGYLKHRITTHFNNFPICSIGDNIYLLLQDINPEGLEEVLSELEIFLNKQKNVYFAGSQTFNSLNNIIFFRLQVDFALKVSRQKDVKLLTLYNDHALDHLLYVVKDQLPFCCYVPKEIEVLLEYDKENNTQYGETLKVYLYNFLDSNKTYIFLNIHRNTLLHRLNKIEQITNINLNDTDLLLRLLLAFKIMDQ